MVADSHAFKAGCTVGEWDSVIHPALMEGNFPAHPISVISKIQRDYSKIDWNPDRWNFSQVDMHFHRENIDGDSFTI